MTALVTIAACIAIASAIAAIAVALRYRRDAEIWQAAYDVECARHAATNANPALSTFYAEGGAGE